MSQDLPIPRQESRFDETTVVEWGEGDPAPRGRVGRSLAGLAHDHRLPPVLAGLGAAAAVASMVGEWLVMTVPTGDPQAENGLMRIPNGVSDVGGFGVGYLVGLLGLATAVALALRGASGVRHNARVAGLGLAAAVLAVLTATALSLDSSGQRALFLTMEEGFRVEYGRGLVSAFLATALLAAALHLSGRTAGRPERTTAETGDAAEPEDEAEPRGRRRRRARSRADDRLPGPADLTVEPTMPFARPERPS